MTKAKRSGVNAQPEPISQTACDTYARNLVARGLASHWILDARAPEKTRELRELAGPTPDDIAREHGDVCPDHPEGNSPQPCRICAAVRKRRQAAQRAKP